MVDLTEEGVGSSVPDWAGRRDRGYGFWEGRHAADPRLGGRVIKYLEAPCRRYDASLAAPCLHATLIDLLESLNIF